MRCSAASLGQLAGDAADLAQAQYCASADDAAFRLDRLAAGGLQRQGEGFAARAQVSTRARQVAGRFRCQPAVEVEHVEWSVGGGDDGDVADDLGAGRAFGDHITSTCGSALISVLARSTAPLSGAISLLMRVGVGAARRRVRTSRAAHSTANTMMPTVTQTPRTGDAGWWR